MWSQFLWILWLACFHAGRFIKSPSNFQTGDIIFQISRSSQSKAIQAATHSPYSHVGVIIIQHDRPFVYEASLDVHALPLSLWIAKGVKGEFVVKRLRHSNEIFTPAVLQRFLSEAQRQEGKPYDYAFAWDDERMYCSELVWKLYDHATGLRIGEPLPLKQYDLSAPAVQRKLKERYGGKIPREELMISPGAIFDSDLLIRVH